MIESKMAEASDAKQSYFWRAVWDALVALYQTVRGYIMPLLIGCLVLNLGLIESAVSNVYSMPLDGKKSNPQDIAAVNLYNLISNCTAALVITVMGMGFYAIRNALLRDQKRRRGLTPLSRSDRSIIFCLEAFCLSVPCILIENGFVVLRHTNLFLRRYLLLPPIVARNPIHEILNSIIIHSWSHPRLAILLAVLIFLVVYTPLATWRIYINDRNLRNS